MKTSVDDLGAPGHYTDAMRNATKAPLGWMTLAFVSLRIVCFGVIVAVLRMAANSSLYRADGLASIGLGWADCPGPVSVMRALGVVETSVLSALLVSYLLGDLPPGTDPSTRSSSWDSRWQDYSCRSAIFSAWG